MKYFVSILVCVFLISSRTAYAETKKLDEQSRVAIVGKIIQILANNYIHPEKVSAIEDSLLKQQKAVQYKNVNNPKEFAGLLTRDLFELSNDLHFHVQFNPELVEQIRKADNPELKKVLEIEERRVAEGENFDFKQVATLEGAIGYFKFDSFSNPEFSNQKLSSIMNFLSSSEALIIDLRDNNGGYLELAQMMNSYFFENDDKTAFFEFYYFEDGERVEKKHWVLPYVVGQRMLDIPIYILTSNATFSAAEWMAYSLKHLGRAVIVGEVTAGGAHPVASKVVDDHFVINVPIGEITSPSTGGDFEGRGVLPDITVNPRDALHTAHLAALVAMSRTQNSKQNLQWYKPLIEARLKPIELSFDQLKGYSGGYGSREIIFTDGRLYYSSNGKNKFELTPLTETLFSVAGIDDFRIQMITQNDEAVGYKRIFKNGDTVDYLK